MTARRSPRETARTLLAQARTASWRHPRWMLAAKTALAAALAWLLVEPLGGMSDDYPYYAPLGAVAVMSTTVVSSVRGAMQAVAAIALGAALALGAQALPLPGVLALTAAIAAGTLLAGWRVLGPMGGWVPFAALFVLIVGGDDPLQYAAAYGGLTALGAAVGIGVNLLLPQLPLAPAALAQERLREELANHLDRLADGLVDEEPTSSEQWQGLRSSLRPHARRAEELVAEAMEARRGNWLARRWTEATDRRYDQARALQRLTGCVDEVIELVADPGAVVHAEDREAEELRAATAAALREVAEMLRSADRGRGKGDDEEAATIAVRRAEAAVARLRDHAASAASGPGPYFLPAAAVAACLERAVEAWA